MLRNRSITAVELVTVSNRNFCSFMSADINTDVIDIFLGEPLCIFLKDLVLTNFEELIFQKRHYSTDACQGLTIYIIKLQKSSTG